MMATEKDTENSKKSFLQEMLEIHKVPCARQSFLYGILGGLGVGLGHFLATSKVRRSYNLGIGGFFVTTLGCWFYCRYNNAKLRFQQRMIQEAIKNKILFEGTQLDPTMKTETNHEKSR
ncbi:cytochrome c oxidase assembly protein COX20, mitochondrial [Candoia aspera]|uniref:cytochrome c oxidase assembly protein COX20, mitochondrial n=1 Tax=Candoia aspera TaxID=51853 RepID=UPI002FD83789